MLNGQWNPHRFKLYLGGVFIWSLLNPLYNLSNYYWEKFNSMRRKAAIKFKSTKQGFMLDVEHIISLAPPQPKTPDKHHDQTHAIKNPNYTPRKTPQPSEVEKMKETSSPTVI